MDGAERGRRCRATCPEAGCPSRQVPPTGGSDQRRTRACPQAVRTGYALQRRYGPDVGCALSVPRHATARRRQGAGHRRTRRNPVMTISSAPLAGIRIADFTIHAAEPFCTHLLSQLGAECIKIESSTRPDAFRSEEHTSEFQSRENLVCRLLLEKKNKQIR